MIPRSARAAVFLMDGADFVGVPGGVTVTDSAAAVGRAVVHQQQLIVLAGLRQNRVDTLGKIDFDAVNGDDQAKGGHGVASFDFFLLLYPHRAAFARYYNKIGCNWRPSSAASAASGRREKSATRE